MRRKRLEDKLNQLKVMKDEGKLTQEDYSQTAPGDYCGFRERQDRASIHPKP